MFRNIVTNKLFVPLLLIIITFIVYINILPNQLFYDDEELIYKNVYVANFNLIKFFSQNTIAGAGKVSNMYRPILLTSFAIDYQIWKGNPLGYHLTSILLHAANGILIFFFINILFKNKLLSFITSLLFIVHPVQTEAVAYASGRTDPLSTLFILTSLLLFLRGNYSYIGSLLFFILAILSKETAVILPFLLLLTITFLPKVKINFKKIFLLLFPFFLIDFIYLALRLTILNFSDTLNFYQVSNLYSTNLWIRLFTFFRVFFEYLSVLIFPKDLIFGRDIQSITSVFNSWVFAFLITFIILFLVSVKIFSKNGLFFFSLSWFFITILPTSGIIPINSILTEHYLYLPSISFFLIIAYIFSRLINLSNPAIKTLSTVFLLIVMTALLIRTIIRNFDWKDAITFYTISLKQSPWHIPMRHNLAMTYADKGEYDVAINEYKTLISLSDVYPQVHHNLANAYKATGKYKEAEKEYLTAIKMDPNFYFSYYALFDLYQKTGNKEELDKIKEKLEQFQSHKQNI